MHVIGESLRILVKKLTNVVAGHSRFHRWRLGVLRYNAVRLAAVLDTGKPIRILSVEVHPVFREGLATIIGSQRDMVLVAQATSSEEAIEQFHIQRPDITLMDLRLPGRSGTELVAIRREFPKLASSC